ncbi:hypothetical protein Dsin_008601 [Dipteronia sinensis]|uniref:Uncharacterized protein n=1 Tax=Dipteronia sinensis TaxID=43782 RepID=A0AAE0ANV7_9ROSI|nr:hypothetical protein Dsin_008601 [Dipteronia sinensis]
MDGLILTDEMGGAADEAAAPKTIRPWAKLNLRVTILASRFAANTRKGMQKIKDVQMPKLRKLEEPDFSTKPNDD